MGSTTVIDVAGNEATFDTAAIKIDKTAPVISLQSKAPQANAAGWNKDNVTVTWTCTDAVSQPLAGTVSQQLTTEGTNLSSTGTCTDNAGNTANDTQTGINIDKTKPTLVFGTATGTAGIMVGLPPT